MTEFKGRLMSQRRRPFYVGDSVEILESGKRFGAIGEVTLDDGTDSPYRVKGAGFELFFAADELRLVIDDQPESGTSDVDRLARALSESILGVVDLRFTRSHWCVMVSMGNVMVVVPGSIRDTPEASLQYCIGRWDERSPCKPFLWGTT